MIISEILTVTRIPGSLFEENERQKALRIQGEVINALHDDYDVQIKMYNGLPKIVVSFHGESLSYNIMGPRALNATQIYIDARPKLWKTVIKKIVNDIPSCKAGSDSFFIRTASNEEISGRSRLTQRLGHTEMCLDIIGRYQGKIYAEHHLFELTNLKQILADLCGANHDSSR